MTRFLLFLCLSSPLSGSAQEAITLNYNERPPYLIPGADGSASGLTATPAANAFKAAGISVVWAKLPTNRQLALVKESMGMNCAIGWFKNPEREQFAKFTKSIYQDKPAVILASKRFVVGASGKLDDVLATKGVRVLVKDNFSYGPYIDGLLATLRPIVVKTVAENAQMVQMIQADRADFMFLAEEEARYLVEQAGFKLQDFHLVRFADMPPGERRYIMCSRQVPDEVITKLNKVIGGIE